MSDIEQKIEVIELSEEDAKKFVQILENPPLPSKSLVDAVQKYNEWANERKESLKELSKMTEEFGGYRDETGMLTPSEIDWLRKNKQESNAAGLAYFKNHPIELQTKPLVIEFIKNRIKDSYVYSWESANHLVTELEIKWTIELLEKQGISAKSHPKYPHLLQLKYNQFDADMSSKMIQQCRGLIIDLNTMEAVAWPFDKFFNADEAQAAPIDWESANVYEKLDGTLCILYWYDNKWNVATMGSADASGPVGDNSFTFCDLFWEIWNANKLELPQETYLTFMFELTSPSNRVVVDYKASNLTLVGVKNRQWGTEEKLENYYGYDFTMLKHPTKTSNLNELKVRASELSPIEQEGYVVVDKNFNRVKVKSPKYVQLHYLKDQLTDRGLIEIVRKNEKNEFIAYFPELEEKLIEVQERYGLLCSRIMDTYNSIGPVETRKEFAAIVTKTPYSFIFFNMKYKNADLLKELESMDIKLLENWLATV